MEGFEKVIGWCEDTLRVILSSEDNGDRFWVDVDVFANPDFEGVDGGVFRVSGGDVVDVEEVPGVGGVPMCRYEFLATMVGVEGFVEDVGVMFSPRGRPPAERYAFFDVVISEEAAGGFCDLRGGDVALVVGESGVWWGWCDCQGR